MQIQLSVLNRGFTLSCEKIILTTAFLISGLRDQHILLLKTVQKTQKIHEPVVSRQWISGN